MSNAFPPQTPPAFLTSLNKDEVERVVRVLVNADLRDVCRQERLAVSGRKTDLQRRILDRLSTYVANQNVNGYMLLKFRVQNPQAALKGVSPPAFPSLSSIPNSSTYHSSPGYSQNHNTSYHSPSHGRLNGANNMPRSLAPPVKFKSSPFYDLRHCVTSCRLPFAVDRKNQVTSRIELTSKDLDSLRMNSSCRVLLFCGELGGGHLNNPTDIIFPHQIEIRVNDQDVKSNTKGVKGKPGSTKPVDITPFLRKQTGSPSNSIAITYASTHKVCIPTECLAIPLIIVSNNIRRHAANIM
jgi:E3 SUMO-protein ligase PIAS1